MGSLLLAAAAMVGCDEGAGTGFGGPPPTSPGMGAIAGNVDVRFGAAGQAAVAPDGLPSGGVADLFPDREAARFAPGEIVVGYDDAQGLAQAGATLTVQGATLRRAGSNAVLDTVVWRDPTLDAAATLEVAAELASRPGIAFAEPNAIVERQATPNDPFYVRQWHYDAIGLPAAWDLTTGSSDVVSAVVDTGILWRDGDGSATHPDLAGKVLPGYDFVADPRSGGDGDGRDADPHEEFAKDTSDHGSHVAGTIAASTNDGRGVAGVDWNGRILPVRALGVNGSGYSTDIVDGVLWAAGFDVDGVPRNPHPADVINLSLGSERGCSQLEQRAYDRVREETEAIVVVAAGNENIEAERFAPANCRNVLTVGATGYGGVRAPYSNYGAGIDVVAPGGNLSVDADGNGDADGVLSTVYDRGGDGMTYRYFEGTSMAAPHVAGVAALMRSVDPNVGADAVRAILTDTARPLNDSLCGAGCGAGLIQADAALRALDPDAGAPAPDVPGTLTFAPSRIDLGASASGREVTLRNVSDTPVTYDATYFFESDANPGKLPNGAIYVEPYPLEGTLAPGASTRVEIGVNRSSVPTDGFYEFAVEIVVDGVPEYLYGSFEQGTDVAPSLSGPMLVAGFRYPADGGEPEVGGGTQRAGAFDTYRFDAAPGTYQVIGWSDENGNGEVDGGDYLGVHDGWVTVTPGGTRAGVDVVLEPTAALEAANADGPSLGDAQRAALERALRASRDR